MLVPPTQKITELGCWTVGDVLDYNLHSLHCSRFVGLSNENLGGGLGTEPMCAYNMHRICVYTASRAQHSPAICHD